MTDFHDRLTALASDVVKATNLSETADPVMSGTLAGDVAEQLVLEMIHDYDEFVEDLK